MRTLWSEKMFEVDVIARAVVHVHQFFQLTRVYIGHLEYLSLNTVHSQVCIVTVDDTCNCIIYSSRNTTVQVVIHQLLQTRSLLASLQSSNYYTRTKVASSAKKAVTVGD